MNVNLFTNKYNLVVCEIHNEFLHGFNEYSDEVIKGHYLCAHVTKNIELFYKSFVYLSDDEEEDDDNEYSVGQIIDIYKRFYIKLVRDNKFCEHEFIINYDKIISNANYIQPHIAKVIYLSGGECIAIIKTLWIKIIQRAWKRVFKKRKDIIDKRKQLTSILYKEIKGKWPDSCRYLPSINGMFWN